MRTIKSPFQRSTSFLAQPNFRRTKKTRLWIFFLSLLLFPGFFPAPPASAETTEKLSDIAAFQSIALHYAGSDGLPMGTAVPEHALLERDTPLVLYYTYEIPETKVPAIRANTNYYLEVSSHLLLSPLLSGSPLTLETEDGPEQFGTIYSDGSRAWVTFSPNANGSGTLLSEYGELHNAYFYLNCRRADVPPEDTLPGESNLYAVKYENGEQLHFGYAEREPVTAKAQIRKSGSLTDKTITWAIDYTPWQNPTKEEGLTMDTPFEIQDRIDGALHSYAADSAKIDGVPIPSYSSRDFIDDTAEFYVVVEHSADGSTLLSFGGTKLRPGAATQGNPAQPLKITYDTAIREELLLPGGRENQKVTNAAELFANTDGMFHPLEINGTHTVPIPRPSWLSKTGKTTRHTDGSGSTTDWTITFSPNGFSFTDTNLLTLHDQLPTGSTLVPDSVKVNGSKTAAAGTGANGFTVSPIQTDNQPVTITYQTQVPEELYDNGTSLGANTAWFTFQYGQEEYETPRVTTPIDSGNGSGNNTATILKTNGGYQSPDRAIPWTVTINPHKANFKSGTFTDDFSSIGPACGRDGHPRGLELCGGKDGVTVLLDGSAPADTSLIQLTYQDQVLTVKVGNIGPRTLTLQYTTKVCDPCIFANNTSKVQLKNTVSTTDMRIGASGQERSASADSTATVSASVLTKKAPVYDYAAGTMKWAIEVNNAGLSMADVTLKDTLPEGLSYVTDSLRTAPEIPGAAAQASGRELTIRLDGVAEKTTVTFDTQVAPEILGFQNAEAVTVTNTAILTGSADNVPFAEVSHQVARRFSNHGLVKSSNVNNQQEWIQYEVLINPFGLALPEQPALVDTLDPRLQLDSDTLLFYKAALSGTTENSGQKPGYTKIGAGQPLSVTDYDPSANCFTVRLPIEANSRDAYVLSYRTDILDRQAGGYGNSVRFEGGSVLLGGSKNNSASVGGGGGGGGGVAARKAGITITKTDVSTQKPLEGVTFTLYHWDTQSLTRGLPFARGTTDSQGRLSFKVKPGASYELVESESLPGYESAFGWTQLPEHVTEGSQSLIIQAGEAKSELNLDLTNSLIPDQWELIVTKISSNEATPLPGATFGLYEEESCHTLLQTETSGPDGTLSFSGLSGGQTYWLKETEAPSGYHPDSTVYKAEEQNPAITVSNTPKDLPPDPDDPNRPGGPDSPDNPDPPGDSGDSGSSGGSGGSGGSGDSGGSGGSGDSGGSGNSDGSGSSGGSGGSGDSDNPIFPDWPGSSGNPILPNWPGGFDPSGNFGSSGKPSGLPASVIPSWIPVSNKTEPDYSAKNHPRDIPQTGDRTIWLIVFVSFTGICLGILTLYHLFNIKSEWQDESKSEIKEEKKIKKKIRNENEIRNESEKKTN